MSTKMMRLRSDRWNAFKTGHGHGAQNVVTRTGRGKRRKNRPSPVQTNNEALTLERLVEIDATRALRVRRPR
jgi:hypothetical protein